MSLTNVNIPNTPNSYQYLIPPGFNHQFSSYLELDSLSLFIQFACFASINIALSTVLFRRYRQYQKFDKTKLTEFSLFEDSDQKKMLRTESGNGPVSAIVLAIFSLIMSINVWVSL